MTRTGLPHSEIPGSKPDCSSPRRIAAYRVLLRPSVPRHPPRALCSLKPTRRSQIMPKHPAPKGKRLWTKSVKRPLCVRLLFSTAALLPTLLLAAPSVAYRQCGTAASAAVFVFFCYSLGYMLPKPHCHPTRQPGICAGQLVPTERQRGTSDTRKGHTPPPPLRWQDNSAFPYYFYFYFFFAMRL